VTANEKQKYMGDHATFTCLIISGATVLSLLCMWIIYNRAELQRSRHDTGLRPHDGPCAGDMSSASRAQQATCLEHICTIPLYVPKWPRFLLLSIIMSLNMALARGAVSGARGLKLLGVGAGVAAASGFIAAFPVHSFVDFHGGVRETSQACVRLTRDLAAAPPSA